MDPIILVLAVLAGIASYVVGVTFDQQICSSIAPFVFVVGVVFAFLGRGRSPRHSGSKSDIEAAHGPYSGNGPRY